MLNGKVDTVSGKGLSTNDYTTTEKNKLAGIAEGAEVNVNADWNAVSGDAQILNKPTIPSKTSDLTNDSGYTSNTGTVTSVAVQMNGSTKGTVTTSGTIDLGTVITDVSGKVNVANIDITGQTTTLLALTKALGTNGIHYARWYSKTDGGSSGISDKPTGSTSAGFVCEAICSRYNNSTDYRYTLICWTQSRKAPYTASIEYSTSTLSWTALPTTVPTKTSDLTNDNCFNYSIVSTAGTIDTLASFTSGKQGLTGSISLTKKASGVGSEIPAGWYNYFFAPHRTGINDGTGATSDNDYFGTIILTPMTFSGRSWILRRSSSTNAISEVKEIATGHLEDYVKNIGSYVNTHPENTPVLIPFVNNDTAFLLSRGGSIKVYYDNVEQQNLTNLPNLFDGSPSYWTQNPTGITTIVMELTLHKVYSWTNTIYCDFGANGWRAKAVKIEVMNTNYASDVWTSKFNTTTNASGNVKVTTAHTPVGADNAGGGFNKIRFTFSDWNNTTNFRIAQLGIYNYGSLGSRETSMSRGIDDYVFRNITPNSNNTYNLGSSSNKWANVYATTFQGNATSATKATGDKNGADITTTYQKKLTAGTNITIDSNNVISASGSNDYTIELPSSWSSAIQDFQDWQEEAWSEGWDVFPYNVDILATTYADIDDDHPHYFVNQDLYNSIDRIVQGDIPEVKFVFPDLNEPTGSMCYVSSSNVSTGNDENVGSYLNIHFEDYVYILSYDAGYLLIEGKYEANNVPYYRFTIGPSNVNYLFESLYSTEYTTNKVTSTSNLPSSTNNQYPSARLLMECLSMIEEPIGTIKAYAGTEGINGYLLCDGSAISRTDYSELFSVIGTTYGAGDGSTTFNLPNLNGKVIVGIDDNDTAFDTLGETGGEKTHTLTVDEMPSHSHKWYSSGSTGTTANSTRYQGSGKNLVFNTDTAGGGQAHNNLQPYIALHYIIKAKKRFTYSGEL